MRSLAAVAILLAACALGRRRSRHEGERCTHGRHLRPLAGRLRRHEREWIDSAPGDIRGPGAPLLRYMRKSDGTYMARLIWEAWTSDCESDPRQALFWRVDDKPTQTAAAFERRKTLGPREKVTVSAPAPDLGTAETVQVRACGVVFELEPALVRGSSASPRAPGSSGRIAGALSIGRSCLRAMRAAWCEHARRPLLVGNVVQHDAQALDGLQCERSLAAEDVARRVPGEVAGAAHRSDAAGPLDCLSEPFHAEVCAANIFASTERSARETRRASTRSSGACARSGTPRAPDVFATDIFA